MLWTWGPPTHTPVFTKKTKKNIHNGLSKTQEVWWLNHIWNYCCNLQRLTHASKLKNNQSTKPWKNFSPCVSFLIVCKNVGTKVSLFSQHKNTILNCALVKRPPFTCINLYSFWNLMAFKCRWYRMSRRCAKIKNLIKNSEIILVLL